MKIHVAYSIHTIYKTIRAINVRFFEYYQTENEICYKISNFIIKILFLVRDKILFIILFALQYKKYLKI